MSKIIRPYFFALFAFPADATKELTGQYPYHKFVLKGYCFLAIWDLNLPGVTPVICPNRRIKLFTL